jgi:dipeptidyl aminopeptidase/acylaminoacyl peptidase
MGKWKWSLCFLVLACMCSKAARNQTRPTVALTPLSVRDALRTIEFGELTAVQLSPDGQLLAYTVKNNERSRTVDRKGWAQSGVRDVFTGTDIYVLQVQTDAVRILTRGRADNFLPEWSPDGRYLAFLSDRGANRQLRLWVWDRSRNELRKVSNLAVRQFGQFEWLPDSRTVIVPVLPGNMSLQDYVARFTAGSKDQTASSDTKFPGSTVVVYQSDLISRAGERPASNSAPWNLDRYLRNLVSINVVSGKTSTIVHGKRIATFFVSPDGSQIAYSAPNRFESPGSQQILFDLFTQTIPNGTPRLVAPDIRLPYDGSTFSWSPDGKHLAYRTGGPREKVRDCYIVDADGANLRNVTMLSPLSPHQSTVPLWDRGGKHLYFIRKGTLWEAAVLGREAFELARVPGREIIDLIPGSDNLLWTPGRDFTVVVTHDPIGKQDGFYKVDLSSGKTVKLLEKGQCYTCFNSDHQFAVGRDGRAVVFFAEDAEHENDVWISTSDFNNPRRLTNLNPEFDQYTLGAARVVDWLDGDGQELHGALLLPAGYQPGQRYPLIVWVYGGSIESNHFDHFGLEGPGPFNMQLFATRGYAVLAPDAPQEVGTPMTDLVKTVLPGVNRVIDMGVADGNRLGLIGHSNGGYSTLGLIVQTNRFKAALEADGMADLIAHYGEMDRAGAAFGTSNLEHGQDALGGTPWTVRDRYIENSPIFYLNRVETPLMVVQGSKDTAVAPFLGDEVFVSLRRLGKQVEYAKYEGEEHSPVYWSYANQVDFCTRMIAWFNRYLKPAGH